MAKALTAQADPLRGSVRLTGIGVPDGQLTLTRTERRLPEVVRGGEFYVSTSGFIREDSEPTFGRELLYRATVVVADRHIQSNRVLNPKAKNGTSNWAGGPGRTLDQEISPALAPPRDAVTSLRIGSYAAGASTDTLADRTLASTAPVGFGSGRWFLSGQVRYDSPDLWAWSDVKANGTWDALKTVGTWQQVSATPSDAGNQPFATLWAAVLSPTDVVVVAPFQVLGVLADSDEAWRTFQAWVTLPVGAPAGCRLVFLHGTQDREYVCTWWLTTALVTPEAEMDGGALPYFDGDTVMTLNPAANLVPDYDWTPATADAFFSWNGTNNSSVSIFTGPSTITATDTITLSPPETATPVREPIYLADPVVPQLGLWFELLGIGELSYAARAELFDVLNRGAQIAVSSKRAWPAGQLQVMTRTLTEYAIAERLFESGRILFLRNPDPRYPESSWYLHIGTVGQVRLPGAPAWRPERIWTIPFAKVERPVGLITSSSSITWGAVKTSGMTWDDVRRQRSDWLDVALTSPT